MAINKEMWASVRESTIHGNISGTWHGSSEATQSYYSSPCILHILLFFQCLCLKTVCAPHHLFCDTSSTENIKIIFSTLLYVSLNKDF